MAGISEFIKQPVEGDTSFSPSNKPIKPIKLIKLPQRETTCSPLPHSSAAMTSRGLPQTSQTFRIRHQSLIILSGLNCDSLRLSAAQVSFSNIKYYMSFD